jgi:hypothetical protein
MTYSDEFDFDPLDPDATLSGHEGVSARNMAQYQLRRRLLHGDEEGIDIVERLRFHAERGPLSPGRVHWPLMEEAAELIEALRRSTALDYRESL